MSRFPEGEGNTPLSADEQVDLIPNLATKEELNEWERQNILEAYAWALAPNNPRRHDPLVESYVRDLHLRMFDQTWKWAGTYRTTEKNIGIPHHEIRERLAASLGDARYWLEHETYPPDELAVRFHHRLVLIHPFANGNGRHSRLMADLLLQHVRLQLEHTGRTAGDTIAQLHHVAAQVTAYTLTGQHAPAVR